jgi:hypothetical protein
VSARQWEAHNRACVNNTSEPQPESPWASRCAVNCALGSKALSEADERPEMKVFGNIGGIAGSQSSSYNQNYGRSAVIFFP